MKKTIFLAILIAAFVNGCAGHPLIGEEKPVGHSDGEKPSLTTIKTERGCEVEKDIRTCLGISSNTADLDVALRIAELDAKQSIVEAIQTEIRTQGLLGLSGRQADHVGRFFEAALAYVTNNIRVSGAMPHQSYWEKYSRTHYPRISYFYLGYATVRISEADYQFARNMIAEDVIKAAMEQKDKDAEHAARNAQQRLLGKK